METAEEKKPLDIFIEILFKLRQNNASERTIEFAAQDVIGRLPKEIQPVALSLYRVIRQTPDYFNQYQQSLYAPSHSPP